MQTDTMNPPALEEEETLLGTRDGEVACPHCDHPPKQRSVFQRTLPLALPWCLVTFLLILLVTPRLWLPEQHSELLLYCM